MGRIKDKLIDQMNEENTGFTPDDTDWDSRKSSAFHDEQSPIEIDPKSGKKLYLIKDYKIWAYSYKQALELLPMIEGF